MLIITIGKLAKSTVLNGFAALKVSLLPTNILLFLRIISSVASYFRRSSKTPTVKQQRNTGEPVRHVNISAATTTRMSALLASTQCGINDGYRSIIPHDFGRQRPVVINNAETLKKVRASSLERAQDLILHFYRYPRNWIW